MVMFMRKLFIISLVISLYFTALPAFSGIIFEGKNYASPSALISSISNKCAPSWIPRNGPYSKYNNLSYNSAYIYQQGPTYSDSECTKIYNSNAFMQVNYTLDGCPSGQIKDPATGQCKAPNRCEGVKGQSGKIGWNSYYWGKAAPSQYVCASIGGGCVALTGESLCINIDPEALKNDPSLYDCDSLYLVESTECTQSGEYPFCTDDTCTDFLPEPTPNPDPEPEPEPQPDPNHNPSDPTAPLPDSGGEVINPSVPPKPPTEEKPKPDVETPDPTPDSNSDVVQSVTGMNEDMNELLTRLNSDNNKQLDDVNNQLLQLNTQSQRIVAQIAKQEKQDAAIYENTKALIQNLNKDVTTAVNKTTNAVNALGSKVDGLSDAVDGLGEDVSAIKDAITNVDTSGVGISGTCIESDTCTGFYESGYPDGISGIFTEHFETVSESVTDTVKDFMKIDLSHAQRPSFSIPVLHFGNFSFDDYINLDWIFGFVRVCMMVSTAFLCRKIIFGG